MDKGDFGNISTPGVELTMMETFRFLLANWMPRDVTADLIFEHPETLKAFTLPPSSTGLN